jgi:hypothetical protein
MQAPVTVVTKPFAQWHHAAGSEVEVRAKGVTRHRGFVDDVMFDGSGVWVAVYGVSVRVFVPWEEDTELWPVQAN